jgi:K+-transporting ATPase ATPase B chain
MTSKRSDNLAKRGGEPQVITVNQGDLIPCDGIVIDGFALVDESAIAGVSTPAMIEAAPGRNQVLAGTVVVEGTLTIQCNKK